jgi:hypothetical protein
MKTLKEISVQYHISQRTLESNLSINKDKWLTENKIIHNGKCWVVDETITKDITHRKYARNYVGFDDGVKVDNVDLSKIVDESLLKSFVTIAPKGVHSKHKHMNIIRDIFEYYVSKSDEPVFFIYGIENNTNYYENNNGYHIHYVTTADYSRNDKDNILEILRDQLTADCVHDQYTVATAPYVKINGGGLSYSLKMNQYTGALIK